MLDVQEAAELLLIFKRDGFSQLPPSPVRHVERVVRAGLLLELGVDADGRDLFAQALLAGQLALSADQGLLVFHELVTEPLQEKHAKKIFLVLAGIHGAAQDVAGLQ